MPSPAIWSIFICYRRVDGQPTADWLHANLDGQTIREDDADIAKLDVYQDTNTPPGAIWRDRHQPALERARALLVVCSPGVYARRPGDDWVHRELDWWLENRKTAPILIDVTGEGERWVPESVKRRWPELQWLTISSEDLMAPAHSDVQNRFVNLLRKGIRQLGTRITLKDLEKQKELNHELDVRRKTALKWASVASLLAVASVGLALLFNAARNDANTAVGLAKANEGRAEWLLYASQITLAHREWQFNEVPRALALLEACRPDFRHWEHRYLERLCRGSRLTLAGHTGPVTALAFSPTNDFLASAGEDSTVRIWDVATGKLVHELRGHAHQVLALAFSADGTRLASASSGVREKTESLSPTFAGCDVKVWEVAAGRELATLRGHERPITSLVFHDDDRNLASASLEGTVKVWDTATFKPMGGWEGHHFFHEYVALSSDGKHLAGLFSNDVIIVDLVTGEQEST